MNSIVPGENLIGRALDERNIGVSSLDQCSGCWSGCVHSGLLFAELHEHKYTKRSPMAWRVSGFKMIRFLFVLCFQMLSVSRSIQRQMVGCNNE
jgi:hypothetical protein